jgi:hypothetical protein
MYEIWVSGSPWLKNFETKEKCRQVIMMYDPDGTVDITVRNSETSEFLSTQELWGTSELWRPPLISKNELSVDWASEGF